MVEVLILSLVQGITEFIPVSSSSHLIIFSKFLNFDNQSLMVDVSLHIGSFLAVITFFHKEIINFVKNKNLFFKIILSSIPVMITGFFLVELNLIDNLRNIKIIGWMTIIFGVLLFLSDKFKLSKNLNSNFTFKNALIIGFFQTLALIPGVSRSGITITGARLLSFERIDAAKISFLMSIPVLGAISIFGLKELYLTNDLSLSTLSLTSTVFSFICSLVTIKFFLLYVKKFSLLIFVIYRIILGTFLLFISYL
jgi:undecaprenyl-diphosphatase